MEKDFDGWNEQQKRLNATGFPNFYHAGEVWRASLGTNIGYEQDGTGKMFDRPVLIIKRFGRYTCLIVPLTTSPKRNKYYLEAGMIGEKNAAGIISQIRLIDTRRLIEKVCVMDSQLFQHIRNAIKSMI